IIPIFRTDEERSAVLEAAERIKATLSDVDIAPERARYRDFLEVVIDDRDMRPGAKFYDWERRGVPIRIELGPKDLAKGQVCVKMRAGSDKPRRSGGGDGGSAGSDDQRREAVKKEFLAESEFLATARQRLLDYQAMLLSNARERLAAGTVTLDSWEQFEQTFAG